MVELAGLIGINGSEDRGACGCWNEEFNDGFAVVYRYSVSTVHYIAVRVWDRSQSPAISIAAPTNR
jgi:hypothetical protein